MPPTTWRTTVQPAPRRIGNLSGNVPLPEQACHDISLRAAEIVKHNAPKGERNSRSFCRATWRRGVVGVWFPPAAAHLVMLDRGIKPFLMTALEGKTIPIRQPDGSIQFRKVKGVGERRIVTRTPDGRELSPIKWRFPGVAPMNFIAPAIKQAIGEYFSSLNMQELMRLMESSEYGRVLGNFERAGRMSPKPVGTVIP